MYFVNSILIMFIMSFILGTMIAIFAKIFEVKVDPRVEKILTILPSYNCGSCGFPGCNQYAEAIINQNVPYNKCTPGGPELANKIKNIIEEKN